MKIENIADVQLALHIARQGSITAAAQALGLSPQTASAALKRLEAQLGARLFERSTRNVRPTPAGQGWLEQMQRALELMEDAQAQLDSEHAALRGPIRLTAPSDLARQVLLPLLDDFLAQHPGVHLSLAVGDQPRNMLRDAVDVAIRYGELADSRLVARHLADAWPLACAAPNYLARHGTPQHPLDLLQHNCLTFQRNGRPHATWRFERNGQWHEVLVQGNRSTDDASLARQWAVAGHGIALKSHIDLQADLQAGRLVPLLPGWRTAPYPLHAILPSKHFIPRRVRALVDYLAQALHGLGATSPGNAATTAIILPA